ncbi:gon-4 like protein muscle wasted isoform X4 [Haemaphysalis longicornis]
MSSDSDGRVQETEGMPPVTSTTGQPETGGSTSIAPDGTDVLNTGRRSPGVDGGPPLVICEQDEAPETAESGSECCNITPSTSSSEGGQRVRDTANQQPDGEGDSAKPVVRTAADSSCEPPPPPSTGHRRKRPREERKGKKKHKRPRPPPTPVPEETDLDRFLEDTAEKNNLTVQNVKNIIRKVVTNTRVLAMLQKSSLSQVAAEAAGVDLESQPFEPKFTRAKAREIMEKQPHLLWPVSPMKVTPPSTSQQLLQQEFPDDSSSDDEYQPASEESEDDTEPPSSVATSAPPFSPPYPDGVWESPEKQEGVIAERTRSKLPLHDTPLECIEAQFIAPDITTDMYDTECDDEEWKEFLCSLVKPFEREDTHEDDVEDPEYNFQEEEEENDLDSWDLRNDPAVMITQKEVSELMTELMQVATRELLETEEEDEVVVTLGKSSPIKESPSASACVEQQLETDIIFRATECVTNESLDQPTPCQIQQLEEQMRMHVQLLTQTCLLCSNNDQLASHFRTGELLLRELERFALRPLHPPERRSLFMACNLRQAVQLLDRMPCGNKLGTPVKPWARGAAQQNDKRGQVPFHARDILADSPVFIYPELLPLSRMYSPLSDPYKKVIFYPSEDHLVALGLEQFMPPWTNAFFFSYLRLIRTFLVPVKTEVQIRVRVKNIIYKKIGEENPIKYWYKHKTAPPQVWEERPVDLNNLLPPSKQPPEYLPMWMRLYLAARSTRRSIPPMVGAPTTPPPILPAATPSTVVCPAGSLVSIGGIAGTIVMAPQAASAPVTLTVTTTSTSPRQILPSPLKQISPILKKYSHYTRKILQKSPVKKRLTFDKEPSAPIAKPRGRRSAPEPTSSDEATSESVDVSEQASCDDGVPASGPEEAEDNEGDLAALMAASSTILRRKQALSRKRSRQQKDAEASLPLLAPGLLDSDPLKEDRESQFTQQYLTRVQEALKDDHIRHAKFLCLLNSAQCNSTSPVQLYKKVAELLHDHQDLVDDFVGFLLPEQALECGKLLQYLNFTKIRLFLRKLEVHLGQQPQQLQRLLRSLHQLQRQPNVTAEAIFSVLQPLLRGQSHLMDELQQLIPSQGVPDSLMEDFEEVTLPDEEDDEEEEEGEGAAAAAVGSPGGGGSSSCEELTLSPPRDAPGTLQCPCSCHQRSPDPRYLSRARHCTRCGIKFLGGRVFLQTGKVLRPARVTIGRPQSPGVEGELGEGRTTEGCAEPGKSVGAKDGGGRKGSQDGQIIAWTREDDKVLLQECQRSGTEQGLQQASQLLGRPPEQVSSRFHELIRLFEAQKSDEDEGDS